MNKTSRMFCDSYRSPELNVSAAKEMINNLSKNVHDTSSKVKTFNVFSTDVVVGFEKGKLFDCSAALVKAVVIFLILFTTSADINLNGFTICIDLGAKNTQTLDRMFENSIKAEIPQVYNQLIPYIEDYMKYSYTDKNNAAKLIKQLNPKLFVNSKAKD